MKMPAYECERDCDELHELETGIRLHVTARQGGGFSKEELRELNRMVLERHLYGEAKSVALEYHEEVLKYLFLSPGSIDVVGVNSAFMKLMRTLTLELEMPQGEPK
jgi:hypothetical protein